MKIYRKPNGQLFFDNNEKAVDVKKIIKRKKAKESYANKISPRLTITLSSRQNEHFFLYSVLLYVYDIQFNREPYSVLLYVYDIQFIVNPKYGHQAKKVASAQYITRYFLRLHEPS